MITKFKKFERYTGTDSAIGFRYSEPADNEANKSLVTFVLKKGDGIPEFYKINNINKTVKILNIDDVEMKIKNALNKVNLDYEIKINKVRFDVWVIQLDFFTYSLKEATTIIRNVAYVIDMAGYEIIDLIQNVLGFEVPKKIGFRYKGYDEEEVGIPVAKSAYGGTFPSEEFR